MIDQMTDLVVEALPFVVAYAQRKVVDLEQARNAVKTVVTETYNSPVWLADLAEVERGSEIHVKCVSFSVIAFCLLKIETAPV